MSDAKFKTMRHIETIRNYLNAVIREFMLRQETHDQSKLWPEEVDAFEAVTPKLRGLTYGSEEYKACLQELGPALQHHYRHNRHHPEFYKDGYLEMNLIDLLEMIVDWKVSGMRHNDSDIFKSIQISQEQIGRASCRERV